MRGHVWQPRPPRGAALRAASGKEAATALSRQRLRSGDLRSPQEGGGTPSPRTPLAWGGVIVAEGKVYLTPGSLGVFGPKSLLGHERRIELLCQLVDLEFRP